MVWISRALRNPANFYPPGGPSGPKSLWRGDEERKDPLLIARGWRFPHSIRRNVPDQQKKGQHYGQTEAVTTGMKKQEVMILQQCIWSGETSFSNFYHGIKSPRKHFWKVGLYRVGGRECSPASERIPVSAIWSRWQIQTKENHNEKENVKVMGKTGLNFEGIKFWIFFKVCYKNRGKEPGWHLMAGKYITLVERIAKYFDYYR